MRRGAHDLLSWPDARSLRLTGGFMYRKLLPDELWAAVEPLLAKPKRRRCRYPGRKPIDDRRVLTGILFMLKTGIPWDDVPCELGLGSGKDHETPFEAVDAPRCLG